MSKSSPGTISEVERLEYDFLFFLLIWLDFHDFWPKFGYIYSFLQGIRIWGQKMPNFRARRGKIGKTNVKRIFSIFYFLIWFFLNLNLGLKGRINHPAALEASPPSHSPWLIPWASFLPARQRPRWLSGSGFKKSN